MDYADISQDVVFLSSFFRPSSNVRQGRDSPQPVPEYCLLIAADGTVASQYSSLIKQTANNY